MKSLIGKVNWNYIILIGILLLALDWIVLPIPYTSSNIAFMGTEIFILILAIFVIKKINKKEYKIDNKNKKIIITTLIFLAISAIEVIYRIMSWGFDMQFFSITRIYIMVILLYFILDSEIIKKSFIFNTILAFITLLNITELTYMLINNSLRTSEIAININIYMCLILLALPIFIMNLFNKEQNIAKTILAYFNLITITVLVPYSGSRIAMLLLVITYIGIIFVLHKYLNKKNILKLVTCIILSLIILLLFYYFVADNYAKSSLYRATNIDKIIGFENDDLRKRNVTEAENTITNNEQSNNLIINSSINPDANMLTKPKSNDIIKNNNTIINNTVNTNNIKTNNDREQLEDDSEMTRTSDILRQQLWSEGIKRILENPLLGKGIITFNYEISGKIVEQSPHNFLLELLLSYGILGTLACITSLVYLMKAMYTKNKKLEAKLIFLGEVLIFLGFASFQPIMMSLLSVLILMYILNINFDEVIEKI